MLIDTVFAPAHCAAWAVITHKGYWISPPIDAAAFSALLETRGLNCRRRPIARRRILYQTAGPVA